MFGNSIIAGVVGVVTAVIGLVIVDAVVAGTVFTTSATLNTIAENIPVLMGVGVLGFAGAWMFLR